MVEGFSDLPIADQRNLLNGYWSAWASPDAHSAVLAVSRGTSDVRNEALVRLLEFSSQEAREIVVDRIRKGDYQNVYGNFPEVLLRLQDETLPELDETLAMAFEQGRPADRLIARYATQRIYPRIRIAYEKRAEHCGEILAYFFRVDNGSLATLRKDPKTGSDCPLSFRQPVARSEGLERVAEGDLDSADINVVERALNILVRGSAPVKEALLKRLEQAEPGSRAAVSIVRTVLQPGDWTLAAEDFARLKIACGASCRAEVERTERSLQSPVIVIPGELMSETISVRIGPYLAVGEDQVRKILKTLPAGARLQLQPVGRSRAEQQRADRIRNWFTALGVELQPQ
jgi:hypothetical protein